MTLEDEPKRPLPVKLFDVDVKVSADKIVRIEMTDQD